ncbi:carcinoembryonic antigen-related cell adhesion molecule 6-like isoform X2 [Ambystoma mexicanum]|uniref:carcinoembryonic antigen-related cell adhesion molecule 6-like isoform X2 n=1 Tax=Ambystoma mexicanum TaxID=8296 RepID=UPI0037E96215
MVTFFDGYSRTGAAQNIWALICTVWMTSLIRWTSGKISITPDVLTAAVGENVILSVHHNGSILYFNWFRDGENTANQILGIISGSHPSVGPKSTGRERGLANGSLTITDVRKNDTGNYTVQMQLESEALQGATAQLIVYMPVSKPTVNINNLQPVENGGFITLNCDASSAAETIHWFFNKKPLLTIDTRIFLSANNQTLATTNVSRNDSGEYQCEASNPISSQRSDLLTVAVAYGPEKTTINPAGAQILQAGATITLSCSALSVPEIHRYEWFRNDSILIHHRWKLIITNATSKDEGNYTCVAHNTVTGQSGRASAWIAVLDAVPETDERPASPRLYPAAIAGIVIAVLVAVVLVGASVYFRRKKRTMALSTATENTKETQKNNIDRGESR